MKIGIGTPSVPEVFLPAEIISVIISCLGLRHPTDGLQGTLWSCCLVSKAWYSATIAQLYHSPLLNNRNFDKLARTICPPVNSRVRRIGLEHFITHLDMGNLAYESSKSLTARLLRRTHPSLEIFVAPAVSFSLVQFRKPMSISLNILRVACLAPLSKCQSLRILDLSRDFYDIDLPQLLHAVGRLSGLKSLSLPKSAFRKRYRLKLSSTGSSPWPPNLKYLQINNSLPADFATWDELIKSFPPFLSSLACYDSLDYNAIWCLYEGTASASQIASLYIGPPRPSDELPLRAILRAFPRLKTLSVPCSALPFVHHADWKDEIDGAFLESLDLRADHEGLPTLSPTQLQEYVKAFPRLKRIDLVESSLRSGGTQSEDFEELEAMIEQRAGMEPRSQSGIFLNG